MLLTLYKTLDGDNVINKTLTDNVDFIINLKSDTDISAPVLTMQTVTGIDYKDFNYCYIDELERFYFIREKMVLNSSVYKLFLETDFLETYKLDILNSQAYYKRKIELGDYGNYEPVKTGREIITDLTSEIVLEESENSIMSVYRWG